MIQILLLLAAYVCWGYALVAAELNARDRETADAAEDARLEAHGARLRARIHRLCELRVRS